MNHKKYFLSCDWGTSAFRLRLINNSNYEVISEWISEEGIAQTYQAWKTTNMPKKAFFKEKIKEHITILENQSKTHLAGIDIVISGMASSSMGMLELPYAALPFDMGGNQAILGKIEADEYFSHTIHLISGVRSDDDVMRGEETQLVGLMNLLKLPMTDDFIFILPGTHSKHIYTEGGRLVRFHTYMTGEMFNLLSNHSILKDSIDMSAFQNLSSSEWLAFKKGVLEMNEMGILNRLFKVRTNQLFDKYSKKENALYLSGLLIGSELKEFLKQTEGTLILCSGNNLFEFYKLAIKTLGLYERTIIVPPEVIDKAVVMGQIKLVEAKKQRITKS